MKNSNLDVVNMLYIVDYSKNFPFSHHSQRNVQKKKNENVSFSWLFFWKDSLKCKYNVKFDDLEREYKNNFLKRFTWWLCHRRQNCWDEWGVEEFSFVSIFTIDVNHTEILTPNERYNNKKNTSMNYNFVSQRVHT